MLCDFPLKIGSSTLYDSMVTSVANTEQAHWKCNYEYSYVNKYRKCLQPSNHFEHEQQTGPDHENNANQSGYPVTNLSPFFIE